LEWDAPSEGPTAFQPTTFSWRTLNWVDWITHPTSWLEGLRLAWAFQQATQAAAQPALRAQVMHEVAVRAKNNESFFLALNRDLGGKLLLPGLGSLIVARNDEEVQDLSDLAQGLKQEGRALRYLTREEVRTRFGFVPSNGKAFAMKPHDRILTPDFIPLLAQHVIDNNGKVINGYVTDVFTDDPTVGGVVCVTRNDTKETQHLPFSKLVLSLGNQRVLGKTGAPLMDIVAARGVSALAVAYVAPGISLPAGTVCGATNHATALAGPIAIEKDGKASHAYLLKLTCSATITPNVTTADSANYDSVCATGLMTAVRQTLDCPVEVFTDHREHTSFPCIN
jgi:hypothetical protein